LLIFLLIAAGIVAGCNFTGDQPAQQAATVPPAPTTPGQTTAVELIVGSWNVESGEADPQVVGQRLAAFEDVDLWGLSEVSNTGAAEILEAAAEQGENANFEGVVSRSGSSDRLVILYNAERFELLATDELEYINLGGSTRAPILVHLRDRPSGHVLVFMANHLNRGNEERRHDQAALLNEWAIIDNRPAIAVGDYNFDWEVVGGDADHDLGYDYMTAQQEWIWVRPASLARTQCSGWPCGFNSVLDFVFVANGAQSWPARSQIIVVGGDFPDDATTSDHRPLLAWFQLPVAGGGGSPLATPTLVPTAPPGATATATLVPTAPPGATLRIIAVDKRDEFVDLANHGGNSVNLAGWVLRSERGRQDCPLDGAIAAGQTLRIWAMAADAGRGGFNCGFAANIWSNSEPDPAVLLDPTGAEISRFE
jgi:endonuclease/exonuclease/phosphatase family metal-dependent hydrolase